MIAILQNYICKSTRAYIAAGDVDLLSRGATINLEVSDTICEVVCMSLDDFGDLSDGDSLA